MLENVRRIGLIWLLALASLQVFGQKMSVASFELLEHDLTANTQPGMKLDFNGEKCAIIKIQTTEHNFAFDVGSLGVVEKVDQNDEHPGEIWLYVPHGVKSISIQHPQLGNINNYDLGESVKRGKTYLLQLTADQVNTLVVDYGNSQILRTSIIPPTATYYINGIKQQLDTIGVCEIQLPFGTHNYRVTADAYYPEEGKIVINDKENRQEKSIRLKQAFGYLSLPAASKDMEGAEVRVDGEYAGRLPLVNFPVKSGSHSFAVSKKLFKPYSQEFSMTDSAFVNFVPVLDSNYADVKLAVKSDKSGMIFDNGELLGTGKWNGRLEAGTHRLEVRKGSHAPSVMELKVTANHNDAITLDDPTPIYGTLELATDPVGTEVLIDGVPVGSTPYTTNTLLVGNHIVEFRHKGYKNESIEVAIEEGKIASQNVKLTDFCTALVTVEPSNASLYVDNDKVEATPWQFNVEAGEYNVKASAHGYTTFSKSMRLDGTTKDFTIRLKRDYVRKNEFYIQAGYNVLALSGINFGAGFYMGNFNVEGNYILSLSKSEKIYWNDMSGESESFTTDYHPTGGNVKIGYGFRLGNRIRLTPQVGCQFLSLKESEATSDQPSYYTALVGVEKAGAASMTFGARFGIAVAPCLGFSVSPEYILPISKSAGFTALSSISHKIKGYTEGFGCNVSVNLFF